MPLKTQFDFENIYSISNGNYTLKDLITAAVNIEEDTFIGPQDKELRIDREGYIANKRGDRSIVTREGWVSGGYRVNRPRYKPFVEHNPYAT